ncbi:S1 RNA-binding domain-containing protein [Streptococcus pneumoniae]|nr:S1 RNA-binding domain-containing protein [Streptococcus pneumoniae]
MTDQYFLYSSKISSNHTSFALSTSSKPCFELTSSVLSTISKLCFEQPASSFLVCSLIFIEYKCSSKAFIYLTFIIYYIGQKRSRILTLIDQYFLECKNTLKRQGAILTSNTKLLGSKDLLEAPLPKRRSQPSTRSKDFLYQTIPQAQNGDGQASYGKYVYHLSV